MPREELYKRIDKRVDQRFTKEDMLEEVARLISSGTNSEWLKSLGLEYRIISGTYWTISKFLFKKGGI